MRRVPLPQLSEKCRFCNNLFCDGPNERPASANFHPIHLDEAELPSDRGGLYANLVRLRGKQV